MLRFHSPLIEPDVRISRIRLSDKDSRFRPRELAPGAMPTALRGHVSSPAILIVLATNPCYLALTMPHRKTCKRYNNPGDAHALTFSCFQRQPFLSKDGSRQWLIEAIDRARDKLKFHVGAYVITLEHAHLLVWPTRPVYEISDVLNSIKQSVAKRALVFVQRHAPEFLTRMADQQPNGDLHYRFWQRGGGYDRNVFEPATVFE